MVPEVEVVEHVDDVVVLVWVTPAEVVKDFDLNEGLVVEPLLVPGCVSFG